MRVLGSGHPMSLGLVARTKKRFQMVPWQIEVSVANSENSDKRALSKASGKRKDRFRKSKSVGEK